MLVEYLLSGQSAPWQEVGVGQQQRVLGDNGGTEFVGFGLRESYLGSAQGLNSDPFNLMPIIEQIQNERRKKTKRARRFGGW